MTSQEPKKDLSNILVVDLDNAKACETRIETNTDFTERHKCNILGETILMPTDNVSNLLKGAFGQIALVVHFGLPNKNILEQALKLLNEGRLVYFYWPNEEAVEVADKIRIESYKKHRLLFIAAAQLARLKGRSQSLLSTNNVSNDNPDLKEQHTALEKDLSKIRGRNLAPGAIKAMQSAAVSILGTERIDIGIAPTPEKPISGTGLYVRLDYWANNLKSGGSYGHTCFLAKALSHVTEDFECIMASRFELIDDLGIKQSVIGRHMSSPDHASLVINAESFLPELNEILKDKAPAYVYERIVLGNNLTAKICQQNNIPYIVEYNGSELAMARSFGNPYDHEQIFEQIENYCFEAATLINVVSKPVADELIERGIPAEKILINPNSVDPDYYRKLEGETLKKERHNLGLSSDHIVVGFCGTYGGWHGISTLAESLPLICRIDSRVRFLLIGDGNQKHIIKEAIKKHGLEDRIIDVGMVPQRTGAQYLGLCNILVATHAQNIDGKTFFGSPTKLFEYMSTEAAIVCSDLAQLGEVMRPALLASDLKNLTQTETESQIEKARGILFTPGNLREFVNSVECLILNESLRLTLGKNARKAIIENYTWDIHAENIWLRLAGLPVKGYDKDRKVLN